MARRKFPDRVAAIVDLMSHLFMLAVMLFVLEIPFRPESSAASDQSLHLIITFESGGRPLKAVLMDHSVDERDLEVDLRLDDGREMRTIEESLKYIRPSGSAGAIKIDGYFRGSIAKKALIILRSARDSLILQVVHVEIISHSNRGSCSETGELVIGRDPVYRFDVDSCTKS